MPIIFSFGPTDDAHTSQGSPTNIGGGNVQLNLRSHDSNFTRVSYLKFTVSDLSSPVTSAILKLYSNTQDGGVDAVACADTSWSESSITWDTRPATGAPIASGTAVPNIWFQIDVTSYITGNGTCTIALETPVNALGDLSSKEGTYPPVLDITESGGNTDPCLAADLDGIPPIDLADFAIVAANWLQTGSGLAGEIEQDGSVNEIDLNIMATYWLSDCGQ